MHINISYLKVVLVAEIGIITIHNTICNVSSIFDGCRRWTELEKAELRNLIMLLLSYNAVILRKGRLLLLPQCNSPYPSLSLPVNQSYEVT